MVHPGNNQSAASSGDEAGERKWPCTVRDNAIVEPCFGLEQLAQYSRGTAKGIIQWDRHTFGDGAPMKLSRRFFGARSGEHAKRGLAFSFCPICGTNISAPLGRSASDEDAAEDAATGAQATGGTPPPSPSQPQSQETM